MLVDTGGYVPLAATGMEVLIRRQAELGISESDLVLLMVDVQTGVTDLDAEIARALLKRGVPTVLVVNKADSDREERAASEFYALGLGEPIAVSSTHGRGVGDLLDILVDRLPPAEPLEAADMSATRVALVGRPNVGKSSLVNALLGEERMIVHDVPGTTRDAVDSHIEWGGQSFVLVDTAGIRRVSRVSEDAEFYSTLRSLKALDRADVAAIVMDASDPFTRQDVRVVGTAIEAERPVLLVLNKWDAVENTDGHMERELREARAFHLPFLPDAPMLFVSAKTGRRVPDILVRSAALAEESARSIPTSALNAAVRRLVERRQPPATPDGRHARIYYATQTGHRPPVITLFVSKPDAIPPHYVRYLQNHLREEFHFTGTPLILTLRARRAARGESLEEIG
jgi:GTP-binding protein